MFHPWFLTYFSSTSPGGKTLTKSPTLIYLILGVTSITMGGLDTWESGLHHKPNTVLSVLGRARVWLPVRD